jgi:hypothetical protein
MGFADAQLILRLSRSRTNVPQDTDSLGGQITRSNCCVLAALKLGIRIHVNFNLQSEFKLIWVVQSLLKK